MKGSGPTGHEAPGPAPIWPRSIPAAKLLCWYLALVNVFWLLMEFGPESALLQLSWPAKIWQIAYLVLVLLVVRSLSVDRHAIPFVAGLLAASTGEGLAWTLDLLGRNQVIPSMPAGILMPGGNDSGAVLPWLFAIPFKIVTLIVLGIALVDLSRQRVHSAQRRSATIGPDGS